MRNDTRLWHLQHALINRVVSKHQALADAAVAQEHQCSYSLLRERTIRIPPRATSRKRMWKPRNSLPNQSLNVAYICPDDGKCSRTNDEEQSIGLGWIFHFRKKSGIKAEG
jgi:hypothetical protein